MRAYEVDKDGVAIVYIVVPASQVRRASCVARRHPAPLPPPPTNHHAPDRHHTTGEGRTPAARAGAGGARAARPKREEDGVAITPPTRNLRVCNEPGRQLSNRTKKNHFGQLPTTRIFAKEDGRTTLATTTTTTLATTLHRPCPPSSSPPPPRRARPRTASPSLRRARSSTRARTA